LRDKSVRAALIVSLITGILFAVLCAVVIVNNPQRALAFAHIGTRFSEHDPNGPPGYDGQFVYYIARDGAAAIPFIDGPSLRYQRILFPLLGRAVSLGNAEVTPWALVILNVVILSIGAGLLAYLLGDFGAWPYFALVYSFWLGNIFAIRFDLTEPMCFALALGAIIAYRQERYRWTIFLLMLSTLTKELGLVIAAGLALHAAFERGKWRWSSLIFGGPLLLFLTWWGIMRLWFGRLPLGYPAAKLHRIPFQGLFSDRVDTPINFILLSVLLAIPTTVLLIAALSTIWRKWRKKPRQFPVSAALVLPAAGFVMTMPDVSWEDPVAAYRIALPIVVAGLLFLGECYPRRLKLLAALWLPAAVIPLMIPDLWI